MRWLALLLVFAFVVPVHAQDKEAEKLYRTMEKKISTCKSLQTTFDAEMGMGGLAFKFKGTLRLAEGDKARIEMDLNFMEKQMKMLMVSDGKTMYTKQDDQVQTTEKPGESGKDMLGGCVARIGLGSAFMVMGTRPGEKKEKFDLDKELPVRDFKLGAREKIGEANAQVVEYTVTATGQQFKVSVWIDVQTSLPLKRTMTADKDGVRFTESYSAFTIDGRLDPKMFEIPK
jgi:outer membrane lipoprotein-sorting protein